jgi:hypothetical protein
MKMLRDSRVHVRSVLAMACLLSLGQASLAPSTTAQVLCKCALRPLSALICANDLTALVRVRWSFPNRSGDHVYAARVIERYHGQSEREIWIQVPASCGLTLSKFRSYVVSVNRDDSGVYTTFACSSFVKPWSELTPEEAGLLRDPGCAPACDELTCPSGERCVLDQVVCVRAPCPPRPVCVPAD